MISFSFHKSITISLSFSLLEYIIKHQRQQYLGSAPLISEEIFNANLQQILKDKQQAFVSLQNIWKQENESKILKEQLSKKVSLDADLKASIDDNVTDDVLEKIKSWHKERNIILIKVSINMPLYLKPNSSNSFQELKYQRELDFKNMQIEQMSYRLTSQDELITKLQEELLQCYHKYDPLPLTDQKEETDSIMEKPKEVKNVTSDEIKMFKQQETQTTPDLLKSLSDEGNVAIIIANLQAKVNSSADELKEKNDTVEQLRSKVTELEMNLSLFRTQIGDKQSQIMFYEKHILELQNKISKFYSEQPPADFNTAVVASNSDEIVALKVGHSFSSNHSILIKRNFRMHLRSYKKQIHKRMDQ